MYDPTKTRNKLAPSAVCTAFLAEESKQLADLYNAEYTELLTRTCNQMYRIFVRFSKPYLHCNHELMTIAAYFMQIHTGMTPEPVGELAAMVSAIKKHFVINGASEDHKKGQLKNQKSWVFPIILLVNDHLAGYSTCRRLKIEPIPFNPDSTMDVLCGHNRDGHDKPIYVDRVLRFVEKRSSTVAKYETYLGDYYEFEASTVHADADGEVADEDVRKRSRRTPSVSVVVSPSFKTALWLKILNQEGCFSHYRKIFGILNYFNLHGNR
jgi:hypothetical protein